MKFSISELRKTLHLSWKTSPSLFFGERPSASTVSQDMFSAPWGFSLIWLIILFWVRTSKTNEHLTNVLFF